MSPAPLVVDQLRCEYHVDPLGIDADAPRLSWRLALGQGDEGRRGARQVAYRVLVATTPEGLADARADRWDSGRVTSGTTAHVAYHGAPLRSGERVHWQVQVWDEHEQAATSSPAWWEMGLLGPAAWSATWIGPPEDAAGEGAPTPLLRRAFTLRAPVRRARLHVTALGLYEVRCNGQRVGNDRLTPGWTDYGHRLQYQTYDVAELLAEGENVLAAELADGWYAGHVGFLGREIYGRSTELLAQLHVELDDGSTVTVTTDDRWRVGTGGRRSTDMLMGEDHDATAVAAGWDRPGFDEAGWVPAMLTKGTDVPLVRSPAPPTKVVAELPARSCTEVDAGRWIYDLGQNLVGWARLRVTGERGTSVTLRFAEVLDADGRLYTENLRTATATDRFVLAGGGEESLEPAFTFHGFRYLEVTGLPAAPPLEAVTGVVLGADLEWTGTFRCSDGALDQLQHNIVWGQRGNFLEVPTDCPQRDERLGWTGDIQVFAPTACFNADVAAFLAKWMDDMLDGQSDDGAFPGVAPRLVGPVADEADGAPGWGDAGVLVPSLLHARYADRRLLERCFPAMVAWVGHVHRANPGLLWLEARHGDMGDWLSIDADSPKDVVATSFFARSATVVAEAADFLGQAEEGRRLRELAAAIRAAYVESYVDDDGRIAGDTQTVYALALRFDLLPPDRRAAAAAHLRADIEARGWRLSTGFLGVAHLLPALSEHGHLDAAYRLLHQTGYPSWLYAVEHGATTIWERWDGWTEHAGFQDPAMNSFNHYAFGAVGEWLYETVAGIRPDAAHPGFERVLLAPQPGGELTWVEATHRSLRGDLALRWERDGDGLVVDIALPPGCDGDLRLPIADGATVVEGGQPAGAAVGVEARAEPGRYTLAPGTYRFTIDRFAR